MLTGVKGDEPREDMAAANEDHEDCLRAAEYFSPDGPRENLTGVGHIVDVWVAQFEQADHIARSRRNCAKSL